MVVKTYQDVLTEKKQFFFSWEEYALYALLSSLR